MSSVETLLAMRFDPVKSPLLARVHERLSGFSRGTGQPRSGIVDLGTERLIAGGNLSDAEATSLFSELITGGLTDDQIGALLILLRPEVLPPATIAAFAKVMRRHALRVSPRLGEHDYLVDTCGTGSDTLGTFNVSTTIMFILAADGVKIAKHGNRAVTSRCGSANVLSSLGARIDLEPDLVARCIEDVGIGFMYAPVFHRAFQSVQRVRIKLAEEMPPGVRPRTVFNVLGPLANPAGAKRQIIGVYDVELVPKFAEILKTLEVERALVAFGHCDGLPAGLDEFSTAGKTTVAELDGGRIRSWEITPEEAGLSRVADPRAFAGGDEATNAQILRRVLHGEERGARMDLALLNAGAGLYLAGKVDTIRAGVVRARELIRGGGPARKLEEFIAKTIELHP